MVPLLESAALYWSKWASASFLHGYFAVADNAPFIPPASNQVRILLDTYLLERAMYEMVYELDNRIDMAAIPLHGLVNLCSD
jgi:maltose alpha-D-glucosyltransferase/alpha-amylase